ncbi:MAG TPA: hypothetical protein VFK11_04455, partial [Candidatus Saccharimonadales bacterium]|nr:hypothetical protein [Candidatus Saccharimonadales bacterium]
KRISGPVFDRIDLFVDVDEINHGHLLKTEVQKQTSASVMDEVDKARKIQIKRSGKLNSRLSGNELKSHNRLTQEAEEFFNQAAKRLGLSARGYMRTLRVANTIADLDRKASIGTEEIGEALQYRKKPAELL